MLLVLVLVLQEVLLLLLGLLLTRCSRQLATRVLRGL